MYYVDPIIKNLFRYNQAEGRAKYIRLDQNENPDGVPKWLFDEVMEKITPEYLSLYPEEIIFREKYAKLLGINSDEVTFTDGSVVAMNYVVRTFGQPGKNLVCVTPTFGMYKVYAEKVARLVSSGECEKGIVICASGIGISIATNKVKGIRCGVGYCDEVAKAMRLHNDANIIAFGQDYMSLEDVIKRVKVFLNTDFLGSYHLDRVKQISELEKNNSFNEHRYKSPI